MENNDLVYKWITYEDLKEILSDVQFITEAEYESMSILKQIEKLCLLYDKLFNKARISWQEFNYNSGFSKYFAHSEFQEDAEKCFLLGINIVYRLRAFLFQEDIVVQEMMFTNQEPIGVYEKSILELLNNNMIKPNLSSGIAELKIALSEAEKNNLKKEHLDKWNKILSYAGMDGSYNFAAEKGDTYEYIDKETGNKETRQRFRHQSESRYTVVTGDLPNRRSLKYYYQKGDYYMRFNRGNLFEWFSSTIAHYSESTRKGTKKLFTLMMDNNESDYIAGYKQGDFYSKEEQVWIQSKYGSHTLGTLTSINKVIMSGPRTKGILKIIQEYNSNINIKDANKKIQEDFLKLFTVSRDKNVKTVYDDGKAINNYKNMEKSGELLERIMLGS